MTIKTGNVSNAGTDSNVFIIIYGKSGRTAIHQLNNRLKNDFERNTASEFMVRNYFSLIFNDNFSLNNMNHLCVVLEIRDRSLLCSR